VAILATLMDTIMDGRRHHCGNATARYRDMRAGGGRQHEASTAVAARMSFVIASEFQEDRRMASILNGAPLAAAAGGLS
jgi:hypothetical protein